MTPAGSAASRQSLDGQPGNERRARAQHDEQPGQHAADGALDGLRGRDGGVELVAAEAAAGEVGARVVAERQRDRQHHPGPPVRRVALQDRHGRAQQAQVEDAERRDPQPRAGGRDVARIEQHQRRRPDERRQHPDDRVGRQRVQARGEADAQHDDADAQPDVARPRARCAPYSCSPIAATTSISAPNPHGSFQRISAATSGNATTAEIRRCARLGSATGAWPIRRCESARACDRSGARGPGTTRALRRDRASRTRARTSR